MSRQSFHVWMSRRGRGMGMYCYNAQQLRECFHLWMSHVTCEWVMSHMNELCHTWMSHVTHEWVMNHVPYEYASRVTYKWVMSHMNKSYYIQMRHVTYEWVVSLMNESWIISHMNTRVVSRKEWVMSHMNTSCHIWMRHVTYEWVISHMNESWIMSLMNKRLCFTYEWVMLHIHRETMGLEGGVSSFVVEGRNHGGWALKFLGMMKFMWAILDLFHTYSGGLFCSLWAKEPPQMADTHLQPLLLDCLLFSQSQPLIRQNFSEVQLFVSFAKEPYKRVTILQKSAL